MRVAVEDAARVGDLDPVEGGQRVLSASSWLWPRTVNASMTWGPISRARVQGPARVLVDHRCVLRPELADLVVAHLRDVVAVDEDPAAGDPSVPWQVADGRVGGRGLAAAGLADQPIRLARRDLERDAAQHRARDAADHVGERQVLDLEGGGRCRGRGRRRAGSWRSFGQDRLQGVGDQVDRDDRVAMARAGNTVGHQTPADHVRVLLTDREAPVR